MFRIVRKDFFGVEKIVLLNTLSGEYLSVIPTFGGNINELVLCKQQQLHSIIAGDKTLESLSGIVENAYRGAKLSPFPNRINNGTYAFNGKHYFFNCNQHPHALHGLLWNALFEIKDEKVNEDGVLLVLVKEYNKDDNAYPFQYSIEIEYHLTAQGFTCITRLYNNAVEPILIADGWHPYLSIGGAIDLLLLQIPSQKQLELADTLIPTGNYINNTFFQQANSLKDVTLDHCFELDVLERKVETLLINESKNVTVVLWQQCGVKGYNFIQVYTPPDRRSIAIEPMTCAPDAFNNKNGVFVLDPQESVELVFGIHLN